MKKRLVILFALLITVLVLFAACGEAEEHVHDYGSWIASVDATCTQTGSVGHFHCSGCNKDFDIDKNEIADVTIPKTAHVVGDLIHGTAATCTEDGVIDHYVCSICHTYLNAAKAEVSTIVAPATGHTVVVQPAVPATCTENGMTEGRFCSVCGTVLAVQEEAPATGHSVVIDPAVAPTCTERGLTEGSHCEYCGTVFKKQQTLLESGHSYVWVNEAAATCTAEGSVGHYHCEACGKNFDAEYQELESVSIPKKAHSLSAWTPEVAPAPDASCLESGTKGHYTCEMCGKYFDADRREITNLLIPGSNHVLTEWLEEVPAICGADGTVAHYHCLACGKNFNEGMHELDSIVIPMPHDHNYEWKDLYSTFYQVNREPHYLCTYCGKCFDSNYRKLADSESMLRPSPLSVSTAADIVELANRVKNGESYAGQTIYLTADINMTGVSNFYGIGSFKDDKPFSGSFNGLGHTITYKQAINNPSRNGGLFAFIRVPENGTATIQNLHVAGNITLTNEKDNWYGYIGGLVSTVDAGKKGDGGEFNILNCWSSVRIDCKNNRFYGISGFLGIVDHADNLKPLTIHIDSCLWDGVINAGPALEVSGGFLGYSGNNKPGRTLVINISNSIVAGTIMLNTSWTDNVGMIAGAIRGSNSDDPTAKVVANISNVISCGKMSFNGTFSDNSLGQIAYFNGIAKLNLKSVYYYAFNRPANFSSPCPIVGSEAEPTSSENVMSLSILQLAKLADYNFTTPEKWTNYDAGYACPTGILTTFGYPDCLTIHPYEFLGNTVEIGTVEEMLTLRDYVNQGYTYAGKTVLLTADLDMTGTGFAGIGATSSKPFSGNFNGQGHTINITQTLTNPDGNGGLFAFIRIPENGTVTIQNLHITGTVTCNNTKADTGYLGGIVDTVDAGKSGNGGTLNITNCWSSVRFDLNNNRWYAISGFVGFLRHEIGLKQITVNIDSCLWDGYINAGPALEASGGLVAYTGNQQNTRKAYINVSNTVVAGQIALNTNWTDDTGLIFGYLKGNGNNPTDAQVIATLTDVIVTGQITSSVDIQSGKWVGLWATSKKSDDKPMATVNLNNFYYKTFDIPGIGAVAPMGTGVVNGTPNAKTLAEIAALTAYDFSTPDAWSIQEIYAPCPKSIVDTFGLPKSLVLPHEHILSDWIEEIPATEDTEGTKGHYDCTKCGLHFDADGVTELENLVIPALVIKIYTLADMKAFRDDVNKGITFEGQRVLLFADLDLGDWTPICNESGKTFSGIFDGQGHTLTYNQVWGSNRDGNAGLFGDVTTGGKDVVIKNLHVTGTLTNSKALEWVGTVVSNVRGGGSLTIQNVWSSVDIICTGSGQKMKAVGGIMGAISGNANAGTITLNIDSCWYSGEIQTGTGKSNVIWVGGILGGSAINNSQKTINVSNCLMTGAITIQSTRTIGSSTAIDSNGGIVGFFKSTEGSGNLYYTLRDCIFAGVIEFTDEKSDSTDHGLILGETSGNDYIKQARVYNCYYRTQADGAVVGNTAEFSAVGYNNNNVISNADIATLYGLTNAEIAELTSATASFTNNDMWHFTGDSIPVPATIYDLFD